MEDIDDEKRAASTVSHFSAWASSAAVLGERDDAFLPVPVKPWFCPREHPEVLAELQAPPMAKLLDLTHALKVDADMFADIAVAWTAPSTATPRLGILVSFVRWAMLRDDALAALQPLVARGVQLEIFYEQQAWGGQLNAWFRHDQIVHNLPGVVAKLGRIWNAPPNWPAVWPIVIDQLALLVRAHARPMDMPALLTEIAVIALSNGGEQRAAMFAHEALFHLRDEPGETTSKALRVLGAAQLAQGRTESAKKLFDQAIEDRKSVV